MEVGGEKGKDLSNGFVLKFEKGDGFICLLSSLGERGRFI